MINVGQRRSSSRLLGRLSGCPMERLLKTFVYACIKFVEAVPSLGVFAQHSAAGIRVDLA